MAMTQKERSDKYAQKFMRKDVKIDKEIYEECIAHINKKGYKSINDFVNCVLRWDMVTGAVPAKKDIEG